MRLSTLLTAAIGAAAGYAAARVLLDRETLPEALPDPVRDALANARSRLRRARTEAIDVLGDAERARREAERSLTAEYLALTGRTGSTSGGDAEAPAP